MSLDTKEVREWLDKNKQGAEALKNSSVYAGIVTDSFLKDPLCALQLGLAVLYDKPIILIVERSCKIPESLVKISKIIERVDTKNPADMERASRTIQEFAMRNR